VNPFAFNVAVKSMLVRPEPNSRTLPSAGKSSNASSDQGMRRNGGWTRTRPEPLDLMADSAPGNHRGLG